MNAQSRTMLALCAHPDDAEFRCGGTLLLLAKRGWSLHIATAGVGDCGTAEESPNAISRRRRQEAQNAAARLGGEFHCLEGNDLRIFDNDELRAAGVALMRKLDPDCVITHYPIDYMPDHDAASAIARAAVFCAAMPNYTVGPAVSLPPTTKGVVPLYYFNGPLGGVDWLGNQAPPAHFYVDISSVEEEKAELLACHVSQREWLRRHHGMDQYLNQMRHWDQAAGQVAGVAYAEGFFCHRGHGFSQAPLLQEALADLIITTGAAK